MFCPRTSSNMLKKIQERSLRVILDDGVNSFADMLGQNVDIAKHQLNIQVLMTELLKIMNNLALPITVNIFGPWINNFNFKNFHEIATERKYCQMWPANCNISLSPTVDTLFQALRKTRPH